MKKTGEVLDNTATDNQIEAKEITLEDVLKNAELMAKILQSDAVKTLIQSETDKVRTKAAREKESNVSEFAKYKAEMDAKIAELSKFQKNYLKTETLKKSGLDLELWDYITGDTEEEILANAKALSGKIQKLAETQVGGDPAPGGGSGQTITKEQFGKMTYTEKAELYQKDRELFEKLSK